MKRRVFLLGLDGASWNVLDRMFEAGLMPNLQRLAREGTRATLESTVPPITPVAWTSLMTGCNPGKHGIYGFLTRRDRRSYLPRPVNRMDTQVPTIFDYFQEGGRLISLNLPMCYPATPINGIMVTCMMTPLVNMGDFEHPRGLMERFEKAGIEYTIDPRFKTREDLSDRELFEGWQNAGSAFVELLRDITLNRMRATHLLLDEESWDCFICVIVGMDRLQHLHWDRLMPLDGGPPDPVLASYYRTVDDEIGRLCGRLESEDLLLIASDHGFVRHNGAFKTNEWLRRQGWLARREARTSPLYPLKLLLNRMGITRAKLERFIGQKTSGALQLSAAHVDWRMSKAYLSTPFGIFLNIKGREAQGAIDKSEAPEVAKAIAGQLRDLRDDSGRSVIANVWLRDEIYHGDSLAGAPDIVFLFHDEFNHGAYIGDLGDPLFETTPFKTGDHRLDGVLVAWGGGVRHLEGDLRFKIWDVLPTLLHVNGRAVPAVCDGRVLAELLTDDRPVVVDENWQRFRGAKKAVTYDRAQEAEIKDRLRDLGYLSDD